MWKDTIIYIYMVRVKMQRYNELKYSGKMKSWIMLENTKKILHIRTIKQRYRKKISHKKHELIHFIIGGLFVRELLSRRLLSVGLCPRPMNYVNNVKHFFFICDPHWKLSKGRMKVLTSQKWPCILYIICSDRVQRGLFQSIWNFIFVSSNQKGDSSHTS